MAQRTTPTEDSPRTPDSGGQTLFNQILVRLVVVAIAFMVIQAAVVVAMYARDRQTLASDLITIEAERIADGLRQGRPPSLPLQRSPYVTAEAMVVYGEDGRQTHLDNPDNLPLGEAEISPDLHEETAREERDGQFFISGLRRHVVDGAAVWIGIALAGSGNKPYLPAIARELRQHVLLPLIPLGLLFLLFNLAIVKRMLTPLQMTVDEVNRLEPAQSGLRLPLTHAPREVRTLIGAINRALARLEHAMDSLRQFTADAAHELRTPLSVMLLSIDQLPAGALRDKLRMDAAGMSRLVNQMLDMAHADALHIPEQATADLDEVARQQVCELYPIALAQGHPIRFESGGAAVVNGLPDVIGRALRNLIQNAMAHASARTEITVLVGPGTRIEVRDRGPGIPEPIREQVTRRFWKLQRDTSSGTGLGLAIASAIMDAHGGRLEIADAPPGGAAVTLNFPPLARSR